MFRAEHRGTDRYQAFRISEAAVSENTDAVRLRRFVVNRQYVAGNGIDIRLFLDQWMTRCLGPFPEREKHSEYTPQCPQ